MKTKYDNRVSLEISTQSPFFDGADLKKPLSKMFVPGGVFSIGITETQIGNGPHVHQTYNVGGSECGNHKIHKVEIHDVKGNRMKQRVVLWTNCTEEEATITDYDIQLKDELDNYANCYFKVLSKRIEC